jgi:hypothetical protein
MDGSSFGRGLGEAIVVMIVAVGVMALVSGIGIGVMIAGVF